MISPAALFRSPRPALARALIVAAAVVAACAPKAAPEPIALPPVPSIVTEAEAIRGVRTAITGGEVPVPVPPQSIRQSQGRGDYEVNFPGADVRAVAKAVLGDVMKARFQVAPQVVQPITLVTPGPVSKATLLNLFETALKSAGLALTTIDGNFLIQPVSAARTQNNGQGIAGPGTVGYGTEVITLQFIAGSELRKILDQLLPGVVTGSDGTDNRLTIAGTTGQRASARDLIKQFDVNWLRNMSFGLFVPDRTDARLIVPELNKLLNANDAPTRGLVRLIAMEKLNGIMAITAQRQYLEDVRRFIEILDREGDSATPKVFVYRVQNGRARDLARTLSAAFGGGIGGSGDGSGAAAADPFGSGQAGEAAPPPRQDNRNQGLGRDSGTGAAGAPGGIAAGPQVRISADEINNAVIVFGTPADYAVVEDALRKLDTTPAQVLIEAAITEVTLNDALRYGVQWQFQVGDANFSLAEGTGPAPTRTSPGFSVFYSNSNISATLNALESRTNVKVVSAPKLIVLNNQTAALQVGNQVPILTQQAQSVNGGGGNNGLAPIVNSVTYRDTGVILRITPRVNASGNVLLDISQEVSGISGDPSPSSIASPTFTTRRVATTVSALDGQVVAIGGLFSDSKSFTKAGIPILSRIPILGSLLFGRTNNTGDRTELIILLKPTVLRTADDGRAVTEELRAKLQSLEPFSTGGRIP